MVEDFFSQLLALSAGAELGNVGVNRDKSAAFEWNAAYGQGFAIRASTLETVGFGLSGKSPKWRPRCQQDRSASAFP